MSRIVAPPETPRLAGVVPEGGGYWPPVRFAARGWPKIESHGVERHDKRWLA